MSESEITPRDDYLLEEYKQRHEYLRFLGTEQSLMAIALLSFNGLALFQSATEPAPVLSILMIFVGLFGIAHNNRLVHRYEENRRRLSEVASQLHIKSIVPEPGIRRSLPTTTRFWFYVLYASITAYWMLRSFGLF